MRRGLGIRLDSRGKGAGESWSPIGSGTEEAVRQGEEEEGRGEGVAGIDGNYLVITLFPLW